MSKTKSVVLDIDDCIYDFMAHLCDIHNRLHNTYYIREDIVAWDLPDDLRKTFKDYESYLYISQQVFPRAKERINKFKEDGYRVILMTARPEDFRKETEFSLKMNGIKYDELFFNKNKSLKINRLSETYDIRIFADDKLSTVNSVKQNTDVPHVYLINMPCNRDAEVEDGVNRINNIHEIRE